MTDVINTIEPITDDEVQRLRAETPGVNHVLHFNHSGSSLPQQPVLDAVIGHLELEARIGGYEAAARANDDLEQVYTQSAALVGAGPEQIALVENATRGWDMVVYGIPFRRGDRVVTTMAEYGSNVLALMQLRKRGLELVVVPDDAAGQVDLERLSGVLDERVRAVLVSHMPTNGGLVQPAAEIGSIVRDRAPDAWYVLDACQTAGQVPLDMGAFRCDALSVTSRKFLRGPRGAGFVAVRQDRLDELDPPMIDNHAAIWTDAATYELRPDARRFETFEASHATRLGMGAGIRYARDIGIERIWLRIRELAGRLRGRLRELDGVTLRDQGEVQGGIVTFTHESIDAADIQAHLSERRINTTVSEVSGTPYDMEARDLESIMRCSVHVITTDEEIDTFVEAVDDLIKARIRSTS